MYGTGLATERATSTPLPPRERHVTIVGLALEYLEMTVTNGMSQGVVFEAGIIYVAVLVMSEWIQRRKKYCLQIDDLPRWLRWIIYYCVVLLLIKFGAPQQEFIYFQF